MKEKYNVVIIGGGTGGISVAARLNSEFSKSEIAVIEPSDMHLDWEKVSAENKEAVFQIRS